MNRSNEEYADYQAQCEAEAQSEAQYHAEQEMAQAEAQQNNEARNRELEAAAAPETKPLSDLANSPDHCRQVWECVVGKEVPKKVFINSRHKGLIILRKDDYEVKVWDDGDVECCYLPEGVLMTFNPFTLVALLTQLGYAPHP